jgi:Optic atrophy 3 protein (OPA3)
MKLLLVGFKLISRPLNNILKRIFMHRFTFMRNFICKWGQGAHRFEIYLNRTVTQQEQANKLDFYIKPLSDEAAFNKGVDYFVEIVFFYGVLISLAIWEVSKAQESSDKLKKQLQDL